METKKQTFKGRDFFVIKGQMHPDYSYHTFEREEKDFRDKYWNIKKDDVVFDIGSSYGSYALTACVMGAKVYAFEPERYVFGDLVNNVLLNSWQDRCYPFNIGLWSSAALIDAKTYAPHWPAYTITSDYKMDTLDNIVNEKCITKLDQIKIDVEGAEEHVIRGGLETIKKFKPNLIIECHDFLDAKISKNISTTLKNLGYSVEEVKRDPCVILVAVHVI